MNKLTEHINLINREADAHRLDGHQIKKFGRKLKGTLTTQFYFECSCGWVRGYEQDKPIEQTFGEIFYKIHLMKPLI